MVQTLERRFDAPMVEDLGDRRYRVVASTPSVARDGMRVPLRAWQLDNFRANPSLSWGHGGELPPIGTVPEIALERDYLAATIEFLPEGVFDFADLLHRCWKAGALRAVSTHGGIKSMTTERGADGSHVGVVEAIELAELAVCRVGVDPGALALARTFNPSEEHLARIFDNLNQDPSNPNPPDSFERLQRADARMLALNEARRGANR